MKNKLLQNKEVGNCLKFISNIFLNEDLTDITDPKVQAKMELINGAEDWFRAHPNQY